MKFQRLLIFLGGIATIVALLAIDGWVFTTWFNTTYFKWYLETGASIGLVSSIASMAWGDMEKNTGLISAHPLAYMGSCLQLVGLPIYTLGTHLRSNKGEPRAISIFDTILAILLLLVLVGVMLIWLVVIAPPQYFVFLICGAPGRIFLQSKRQPIAQLKGTQLTVTEIGSDEKIPEGWWSASISSKPVAITNLFASLFFLIVKPLIG